MPSFLSSAPTNTVAGQKNANAVLPSQQVQKFRNTSIAGVLNNQTPLVNQTASGADGGDPQKSGAVQSLDRQQQMISQGTDSHNNLMSLYAQAAARKAASAVSAVAGTSAKSTVKAGASNKGVAGATNTYSGGGASGYQNDGNLDAARNQVLKTATSYLGTRYQLGGTSHQAIDCSGLVMAVYAQMGFNNLPHNARIQGQIMGQRTSVANLRPGDLVAWNDGSHIAIYAGNGQIIEAANPRVGTVRRKLWSNAVYGVRLRLPGE